MLPITQMTPESWMVFFRPKMSASFPTVRAPTKLPAGIEATMAPWAFGPGYPNWLLYESFVKTPDIEEMSSPNSPPPMHAKDPTRYGFLKILLLYLGMRDQGEDEYLPMMRKAGEQVGVELESYL